MLIFAAATMLWACSTDEGTMPGSDSNPVVTLYSYAPSGKGANPDNDVIVRFATNDKVTSVKYIVVTADEAKDLTDDAFRQKIETEGTVVENLGPNGNAEVTVTGIKGDVNIAAVANGSNLSNTISFTGLDWKVMKTGTFVCENDLLSTTSEATLEKCDNVENLYRINNAFGSGSKIEFSMADQTAEDEDGVYECVRVPAQATPWSYGNYGSIYIRDYAYFTGSDSYIKTSGMYEDGSMFLCLNWYVSAGYLIDYAYSYFMPDE